MKLAVLKPVIWNSHGYQGPSGEGSWSGYPKEKGLGHEEWNNHPAREWRGYRVFHAEADRTKTKRLFDHAHDGQLGMLMIASREGRQWAVGVAAEVFDNDDDAMKLIADELGLEDEWRQLWEMESIRKAHKNDLAKFRAWWRGQCHWVQWKSRVGMYHWFDKMILLNPKMLTGKDSPLAKMFGSYQSVDPRRIARVIRKQIPAEKSEIVRWFEEGPFADEFLQDGSPTKRRSTTGSLGGGNAPTAREVRYWIEGERVYEPMHATLQAQYVAFLREENIFTIENDKYVDVQYERGGRTILVEVKPTQTVLPKFAIRCAIGQLMYYQYKLDPDAGMEVVLGSRPGDEDVGLLKHLKIDLCYRENGRFVRSS